MSSLLAAMMLIQFATSPIAEVPSHDRAASSDAPSRQVIQGGTTACRCPKGYEGVETYIDASGTPHGVQDFVTFQMPDCFEWTPGDQFDPPAWFDVTAHGGWDQDVCVGKDNFLLTPTDPYPMQLRYWWEGTLNGIADLDTFHAYPDEPPDDPGYADYTLRVTADDTGPCNYGDEQTSQQWIVRVWKCLPCSTQSEEQRTVTFWHDFGPDMHGSPVSEDVRITVSADYGICNGEIRVTKIRSLIGGHFNRRDFLFGPPIFKVTAGSEGFGSGPMFPVPPLPQMYEDYVEFHFSKDVNVIASHEMGTLPIVFRFDTEYTYALADIVVELNVDIPAPICP